MREVPKERKKKIYLSDSISEPRPGGLPWQSSGQDSTLLLQGMRVQSLVSEVPHATQFSKKKIRSEGWGGTPGKSTLMDLVGSELPARLPSSALKNMYLSKQKQRLSPLFTESPGIRQNDGHQSFSSRTE